MMVADHVVEPVVALVAKSGGSVTAHWRALACVLAGVGDRRAVAVNALVDFRQAAVAPPTHVPGDDVDDLTSAFGILAATTAARTLGRLDVGRPGDDVLRAALVAAELYACGVADEESVLVAEQAVEAEMARRYRAEAATGRDKRGWAAYLAYTAVVDGTITAATVEAACPAQLAWLAAYRAAVVAAHPAD